MNGPVLTMAPAVEPMGSSFHRSHSTPNLLGTSSATVAKPAPSLNTSLHNRSALSLKSLPSLPAFDVPSFESDPEFHTALFLDGKRFSAGSKKDIGYTKAQAMVRTNEVPQAEPAATNTATSKSAKPLQPQASQPEPQPPALGRRNSLIDRPRSWLPTSRSATSIRDLLSERPSTATAEYGRTSTKGTALEPGSSSESADRPRMVSDSFASFARRSWMTSSRSPSPQRNRRSQQQRGGSESPEPIAVLGRDRAASNDSGKGTKLPSPRKRNTTPLEVDTTMVSRAATDSPTGTPTSSGSASRAFTRASSYLTKIKQRPQSVLGKLGTGSSANAQAANMNGNDSEATSGASSPTSLAPPTADTRASKSDTTSTTTDDDMAPPPHLRDPLWSTFKSLDSEFAKFGPRVTNQRMVLVRATLLPFLRGSANATSSEVVQNLYLEDLERRAIILSKWWGGLLELLDGRDQQVMAGVDRPTLLEAMTLVMMRPEWRQATSYFLPLADRSPGERVRARSWTTASQSSSIATSNVSAAFNAESAEHNIRTMFVNNLLTQMALVVEKVSLRHLPLSLISWAGKACAYGFFFCPGVAEILVRLWGLGTEPLRRVADEFNLPRRSNGESDDIVALFPPSLAHLGWSSVRGMGESLKQDAKLPVAAAGIPWHGPWVSRWRGRDTDLFFIFCKYFHILADEFMPSGLPLVEKARAPAFVLVHAQLLHVLDSTIHRQAVLDGMGMSLGLPFSEALQNFGIDASAMALAMPPSDPFGVNNFMRGMSESRLVVLLREVLSEKGGEMSGARHTFAEAYMAVMKAAARKTSMFDHQACYTLCDFLEEALSIYDEHEDGPHARATAEEDGQLGYVDWQFWFEACKRILNSLNTMSEIRMLAFVFSTWDVVAAEPRRKEMLCLDWLLTEETFNTFFNHWCPMVRAYYMRLLCWRICRDAGSANEVDAKIFLVVAARLKTVWAHYLYQKQTAENNHKLLPSTAPSLPTPGKKFMIVRMESNVVQPGIFLGFDSFTKATSKESTNGSVNLTSALSSGAAREDDVGVKSAAKKRWSLVDKMLSLTAAGASLSAGAMPTPMAAGTNVGQGAAAKPSLDEQFETMRRETAASRSKTGPTPAGPPLPPKPTASGTASPSSDGSSTGSSPIFDAQQYVFKFVLSSIPQNAPPIRNRILTRPRLPAPAQAWVSSRSRSGSPPPPAPGLPAATRRVSGLPQGGLINDARNASPLDSPAPSPTTSQPRMSFSSSFARTLSGGLERASMSNDSRYSSDLATLGRDSNTSGSSTLAPTDRDVGRPLSGIQAEMATLPVRPTGIYTSTAAYAGRALAEWAVVVGECNSFVDRRRDEGVLGLSEVEVPQLGVEGFRKLG